MVQGFRLNFVGNSKNSTHFVIRLVERLRGWRFFIRAAAGVSVSHKLRLPGNLLEYPLQNLHCLRGDEALAGNDGKESLKTANPTGFDGTIRLESDQDVVVLGKFAYKSAM